MKYIITEKQLRLITEQEDTENKGRIVYVDVDLPNPNEVNFSRETHPDIYATKYTTQGHPIPLKIVKPISAQLISPDGYVYAVNYGNQENTKIASYESPDKKYYVVSTTMDGYVIEIPYSLIKNVVDAPKDFPEHIIDNFYDIYINDRISEEKMKLAYIDRNGNKTFQDI